MDFSWSETQKRFFDDVESFAKAELANDPVGADREGRFDRSGWEACGRFGLPGLPVPHALGGSAAMPTPWWERWSGSATPVATTG